MDVKKMFRLTERARVLCATSTPSVMVLAALCGICVLETKVYSGVNGLGDEINPPCISCDSRQQLMVEINWSPPPLIEDLAPATILAGYKIFLHNVDDDLLATLVVNDAKKDSLVVVLSTEVTYVLTAVAFTTTGIESVPSTPKEYRFGPSDGRAVGSRWTKSM